MKFLLDMNLSPKWIELLANFNIEADIGWIMAGQVPLIPISLLLPKQIIM